MAQAVMVLAIGDIAYWLFSCLEPSLYDRLFWAAFFTAVLVPVGFVQFQPEATIYLAGFLLVLALLTRLRWWIPARWLPVGIFVGGACGVLLALCFRWDAACRLW